MLGGIYEAQNLAEDVPRPGISNTKVADRYSGVCGASRIPRTSVQR